MAVRFTRTYKGRYFEGDIAGFSPELEAHLVKEGAAIPYRAPGAPEEPMTPNTKQIDTETNRQTTPEKPGVVTKGAPKTRRDR